MRRLLIALIGVYRYLISPLLGNNCRFYPSCSEYAQQAIREHGAAYGTFLAARRLSRCHPWHEGGVDPVPAARKKSCSGETCRSHSHIKQT